MITKFRKISHENITKNVFKLLDKDWMLITAGNITSYNTMTASWGGMGILWNLPVVTVYIRPQRHTFIFAERADIFTLSFFYPEHKEILKFCGSKSGRDYDKAKETGLIPFSTEHNSTAFEQAKMIIECRKIYADDIKPEKFISQQIISQNYPGKDYHRFFIGEIVNVYQKPSE